MSVVAYVLLTVGVFPSSPLRKSWSKSYETRRRDQRMSRANERSGAHELRKHHRPRTVGNVAVYLVAALFFPKGSR